MTLSDYDAAVHTFIEQIKADKSIVQPWRNKACSRLEEVQAFVRMGKTTTNVARQNEPSASETYQQTNFAPNAAVGTAPQATDPQNVVCTCPNGGRRRDCGVHGEGV